MGNAELYDRIIALYKEKGSVKKTAEELGTSVIKVRRVLITEELWSSAMSRIIQRLREQGLNTKQIAEKLHYTEKMCKHTLRTQKAHTAKKKRADILSNPESTVRGSRLPPIRL